MTHIGGELAEGAAAASGMGGPATMAVGAGAHLLKLPIKGLSNMYRRANLRNQIQQAYPTLTGVLPPPSALPSWTPSVGDAIKALTLSQGSQQGF